MADYSGSPANPNSNPATNSQAGAVQLFMSGVTKKNAEQFFEAIAASGAQRIIDVRLHNVSQLAGFAKKEDLAHLMKKICASIAFICQSWRRPRVCSMIIASGAATGGNTRANFCACCASEGSSGRSAQHHCRWLPVVQRRQAASLPSPPRR
jgi:hypothetical protein